MGKRMRRRGGFLDTDVVGVITEVMWAAIIFTALMVLMAVLQGA